MWTWRSASPTATSSLDRLRLPLLALMAISERERTLSSRTVPGLSSAAIALLEIRSGVRTDQMNVTVSNSTRTSLAPFEPGIYFIFSHRLPPVGIDLPNPLAKGSEFRLVASRGFRGYQVYYGKTPPADRYRLSAFDRLDQFRQSVLGICNTDLHTSI